MALLHRLYDETHAMEDGPQLLAVTVDHGLRSESSKEAQSVAAHCQNLDIPHKVMVWEGAKPETGLADAARGARYGLLSRAAIDAGTDLVLTGHTQDDQAETFLMRQKRSSGIGPGLAAMAPQTLYNEKTWFARPLMDHSRADLRRFLTERNIAWIDDPTNTNQRFERARLRRQLADDETLRETALSDLALHVKRRVDASQYAAGLIGQKAECVEGEALMLRDFEIELAEAGGQTALAAAIAVMGGSDRLVPAQKTRDLAAALLSAVRIRRNVGGAVIERRDGNLAIWREKRAIETLAIDHRPQIFDRRYRVFRTNGAPRKDWTIGPATALERPLDWPGRIAAATAPALFCNGDMLWTAGAGEPGPVPGGIHCERYLAPFATFLPEWELDLANAFRGLYGLASQSRSPLSMN